MNLSLREKHSLRIVAAYVVFLAVCLYWERQDHRDTSTSTSDRGLLDTEAALQRLEDGESIKVERWHGHDLLVRGDLVLDADALDEPTGEPEDE